MKRIGLTGNMGTGKSTVARIFEILGISVYKADIQAREILHSGFLKPQLISLFGDSVIDSQSEVDRKALASIVFNDAAKLLQLNNLVHPLVEKDFEQWCSLHVKENYIIHEAAILYESGFDSLFEATILVTAPEELCVARVMTRDAITREMVSRRLQNQWPQQRKQELADYEIVNDGIAMVIPQVLAVHSKILNDFSSRE